MNIIKAGLTMLLFLFVAIVCYFVLSVPFNSLFTAFDTADTGAATKYYNVYIPIMRTGFNMFFAGVVALPIVWFIIWSFHRIPEWKYTRRF